MRNTGLPARFDEYERTGEDMRGLREGAATPVVVEDAVWGALLLAAFGGERLPADAEERLTEFAQLASLALASADARERLLESRERLVRTADAERKRLERNLHDGAQQRLVAARLTLGMLRKRLDAPELDPIIEELALALEELRELARGLHPAALSRGLYAAVGALATRSPVPVEYDVVEGRLPDAGRGRRLLRDRRVDHQRRQARGGVRDPRDGGASPATRLALSSRRRRPWRSRFRRLRPGRSA